MSLKNYVDKLGEIFEEVAKKNIRIYNKSEGNADYLIYPKKRETEQDRISEQETRFLLAKVLEEKEIYYSIETPTNNKYKFSNKNDDSGGGMSAQTDLTIYNNRREKAVNIELKAHNPNTEAIEKDIEKLLGEEVLGAWLHIFENTNSGTITTLREKIYKGIENNKSNIKNPYGIFFYIIVLKKEEVHYRFIENNILKKITQEEFINKDNWETKKLK